MSLGLLYVGYNNRTTLAIVPFALFYLYNILETKKKWMGDRACIKTLQVQKFDLREVQMLCEADSPSDFV